MLMQDMMAGFSAKNKRIGLRNIARSWILHVILYKSPTLGKVATKKSGLEPYFYVSCRRALSVPLLYGALRGGHAEVVFWIRLASGRESHKIKKTGIIKPAVVE